ncbi:MAG: TIGR02556 family CRISPR-associated protein [Methanomassiliicoccales archaeon]|jgi:CRISPR-associated protein Csh1
MIEAIWNLGTYINRKRKKDNINSLIETYIDRAKLARTKKILCITLLEESNGIGYRYKGISIEDYSPDKPILYRPGASNGPDIMPCAIITDPTKTFNKKILAWFKKYRDNDMIHKYLGSRVSNIDKLLNENKEIIESDLKAAHDSLRVDKKNGINEKINVLLTIKFEKDGNDERHLGEDQSFQNLLLALSKERYYSYESGESRGKGTCHLCGQEKELGGYALSSMGFKFSTADKPGFTPNLCKAEYWKAIQICDDCAEIIESGKRFIDENLSFPKEDNFLGCRYYVIPKFIFGEMFDELYDRIIFYKDKDYEEGLLTKEDWVEKELMKKDDVLRLIFLFYEKDQNRFLIHEYVEDVVPSWLKQIDESQRKIRTMPIFQEDAVKKMFGKDRVGDFVTWIYGIDQKNGGKGNNWYAVFLRTFFRSKSDTGNYDKEFKSILSAILSNKKISRDLIISSFVREIRADVRKQQIYNFQILCIRSFMLLLFLKELSLINENHSWGCERMNEGKEKEDLAKSFLETVKRFFDDYQIREADKRAAFCVGMLADSVLYVQRIERRTKHGKVEFGEEPFWDKLRGLMLDETKIKTIFRDSITKLRQYKKAYPDLEEAAGIYLAAAEGKWNSTKDELSYFFALGMTLSKVLGYKMDEENETKNEGGN